MVQVSAKHLDNVYKQMKELPFSLSFPRFWTHFPVAVMPELCCLGLQTSKTVYRFFIEGLPSQVTLTSACAQSESCEMENLLLSFEFQLPQVICLLIFTL